MRLYAHGFHLGNPTVICHLFNSFVSPHPSSLPSSSQPLLVLNCHNMRMYAHGFHLLNPTVSCYLLNPFVFTHPLLLTSTSRPLLSLKYHHMYLHAHIIHSLTRTMICSLHAHNTTCHLFYPFVLTYPPSLPSSCNTHIPTWYPLLLAHQISSSYPTHTSVGVIRSLKTIILEYIFFHIKLLLCPIHRHQYFDVS